MAARHESIPLSGLFTIMYRSIFPNTLDIVLLMLLGAKCTRACFTDIVGGIVGSYPPCKFLTGLSTLEAPKSSTRSCSLKKRNEHESRAKRWEALHPIEPRAWHYVTPEDVSHLALLSVRGWQGIARGLDSFQRDGMEVNWYNF